MKYSVLVSLICLATTANACGPIFNAIFRPPPPPPTYYQCRQVSNGPPCVGATIDKCVCTNGLSDQTSCANDNSFFGFNYNAAQYCGASVQYSGYSSCTCKTPTGAWAPNYNYYQVAVNSNGQVSYGGWGWPYGRKKRSVEMWEDEMKRLTMSKEM